MVIRLNFVLPSLLLCLVSGASLADEASVKKLLKKQFSDGVVESVKKTPYLGLYEVVTDGDLLYTDEKASYFFFGHIVDPKTMQSLTEERMQQLQQLKNSRVIQFDSLPLELAIKSVKGNGQRKLAVFSDPNCPYCRQLEKELAKITNVTIYTMLYPVLRGSEDVAKSIWCSADRLKAWDDLMLQGIAPTGQDCETPLATLLQTGRKYRVSGTPTMVFADGSIAPGMIPAEVIEKRLNGNGTGKK